MVLDSSAIVALLRDEPEADRLRDSISMAPTLMVGAPTLLETAMVLSRYLGAGTQTALLDVLTAIDAEVVPFTQEHAEAAQEAFARFGKGRHPAALNFGDCMAYAIAKVAGHPLLYVGSDFSQTDVESAG